jgi:urocanate hydratase
MDERYFLQCLYGHMSRCKAQFEEYRRIAQKMESMTIDRVLELQSGDNIVNMIDYKMRKINHKR